MSKIESPLRCKHIFNIYDVFENDKETEIYSICKTCGKEEKWIINKRFLNTDEILEYMNNRIAQHKSAYDIVPSFYMENDLSMKLCGHEWNS